MNAMAFMVNAVTAKPTPRTRAIKVPKVTARVREVAQFVADNPGCNRTEVAAAFKCARNTAHVHLYAARCNGLIRCDNRGRFSRWYPVEAA